MSSTSCYAAQSDKSLLEPFKIERRKIGANDVQIAIEFCGVCHSDIHVAKNEWGGSHYPVVPGHEIIGKVTALGKNASHLKLGQRVGVGYMGGSCQVCKSCRSGLEQYCPKAFQLFLMLQRKIQAALRMAAIQKVLWLTKILY